MSYYRGDYYRGDYYRGDLFGGLKKLGKAVLGGVTGFITGGPVGAVTGAIGGLRGAGGSSATAPLTLPMPISQAGVVSTGVSIARKVLPPLLAGKEALDIAQGFGVFGGGTRKRRSMNHLNPKALTRATRRVEGFVKKARKAVSPLGYTVVRRGSGRCAPRRKKC